MFTLTFRQKRELVDKLLDCPNLETSGNREHIVKQLPKHIRVSISLAALNDAKKEVLAIVDTCLGIDGGLIELLTTLQWFDGDTIAFGKLSAFLESKMGLIFQNSHWLLVSASDRPEHDTTSNSREKTNSQKKRDELKKLCSDHTAFIKDRLNSFVGREKERADIEQQIKEKLATGGYVTITGQAGQGKSSVIAKLVQTRLDQLREQNPKQEDLLAYHFIPFNPGPDHQVALLRNLMTRLIIKYDLPEIYIASDNRATLRDMFPNVLRDMVAKGGQEVIFIDGLDQLEHELTGKRDLSFLPNNPPPGVVFILGTRPDDTLKPLELLKPKHEYKLPELSRTDFDLVLTHHGVVLSYELTTRFYEAMQKNALYLDLVAQELRLTESNSPEMVIKKLADNPENLFELAIDRFTRDNREWTLVIKPILGVLIAAQEPMPRFSIKQLLKLDGKTLDVAMQKLGGLLAQDGQGRRYLYHLKLIEYLTPDQEQPDKLPICDQELLLELHAKFANWCENENRSLDGIWQNKPDDEMENFRRRYAQQHYVTHLYHAQDWSELFIILDNGDYGRHKIRDYDASTKAYSLDLELGRIACTRVDLELKESLDLLNRLWCYTLLKGSLVSRVDNYPIELFEQLYLAGREKECLARVELLTKSEQKVEILARLGLLVSKRLNNKSRVEAEILYLQAITLVEKIANRHVISILTKHSIIINNPEWSSKLVSTANLIVDELDKSAALLDIVIAQADAWLFEQAFATTNLLADEDDKSVALKAIAAAQAEAGLLDQALATANFIADEGYKCATLRAIVATQAEAGLLNRAFAIAGLITDKSSKIAALRTIATTQAEVGLIDQALATFQLALVTTNSITDRFFKLTALRTIATAQAKAGLLNQALATANSISDKSSKIAALRTIASLQAEAGLLNQARSIFQRALTTTNLVTDKNDKSAALRDITIAQAKAGLLDQALATANSISDKNDKSAALRDITIAQAKAGLLNQALATANSISDKSSKIAILQAIAVAQAEAGLLNQALTTANSITDKDDKSLALQDIATAQAEVGLLNQALATANSITNESHKSAALRTIASVQAEAGLLDQALAIANSITDKNDKLATLQGIAANQTDTKLLNLALAAVDSLADKYNRGKALRTIAIAQAKAGLLDQALAITNSIADEGSKTAALRTIASAQAEAGLLDQALAIANSITDKGNKIWALWEIAATIAKSGLLDQALTIVGSITDKSSKTWALRAIASVQAEAGLLDQALAIANSITDKDDKSAALRVIVATQAEAELFDQALTTANSITDKDDKSLALQDIATAQAEVGLLDQALATFQLALATANSITDGFFKSATLQAIAVAQAEVGLLDQALAGINLINNEDEKSKITQAICAALVKNSKHNEALKLVQQTWQNISIREQALKRLCIALPLLQIHPKLGETFFESFEWVDNFLRQC